METLRGIVLRTVKYGDNSMIVDLFTEGRGRLSFMASTSRTKRSVRNVSFWQPLSMVEFSVELRPNGGKLPRPNDVRTYYNYTDLPFSPVKSTLALFLAEFLSAALREEKENPLFHFNALCHALLVFLLWRVTSVLMGTGNQNGGCI